MNLAQQLREHLIKHILKDKTPEAFTDDYPLIDTGMLDSLAIMNLIAWLEQHYAIEFGEGDIVLENFNSIHALLTFVQHKRVLDEMP